MAFSVGTTPRCFSSKTSTSIGLLSSAQQQWHHNMAPATAR
eukprot:CAMPEP_0181459730 /NCGR_PEP_ID=MMETSP1110-20121109/32975_1 /TAXON_ID=174948 /ORGANISM="Symbiodinium sp., Strain CCMP421" /LENGTH=40 /DNA_ID= /DNA_START= /DNA_END= /DNA_ORIENTATION=